MRQSPDRRVYAPKTEPKAHSINPAAVAQLGTSLGNHATDGGTLRGASRELYRGRGIEAPVAGVTNHCCGSQGKHR